VANFVVLKNSPCFWEGKGNGIWQLQKIVTKIFSSFF